MKPVTDSKMAIGFLFVPFASYHHACVDLLLNGRLYVSSVISLKKDKW